MGGVLGMIGKKGCGEAVPALLPEGHAISYVCENVDHTLSMDDRAHSGVVCVCSGNYINDILR